MPELTGFMEAVPLEELKKKGVVTVRGRDCPIALFWHEDQVFAVDNRCPHMGFPLDQGTVHDGMLTCHWHHARFDLRGGCTFDLFADDVPSYETRVVKGRVWVAETPRHPVGADYFFNRLQRSMEENIGLVQAKSVIGLLDAGVDHKKIMARIARFGSRHSEQWREGLTTLSMVQNLWPWLAPETRVYALGLAARRVAAECAGQPARRLRAPLSPGGHDRDQLRRWLRQWVRVRSRDGAERTFLTAMEEDGDLAWANELLASADTDRIFRSGGHTFDFTNKALELAPVLEAREQPALLALVLPPLVTGRGQDENSAWRNPIDLIPLIAEAEERLAAISRFGVTPVPGDETGALAEVLLGDDPSKILETLLDRLAKGIAPVSLAAELAAAAAYRLARFPESNDLADWFDPVHAFSHANAVHRSLERSTTPLMVRALLHGAMAVYTDRFLNVPAARLPWEQKSFESLPDDPGKLRDAIFGELDRKRSLQAAPALAARYLRLGHPFPPLADALAMATLREDVDFHKLQVLEAGLRQYAGRSDMPEREIFIVAIVRHLAAHCPTPRAQARSTRIALRLHHGEPVYKEDTPESP